MMSQNVIRKDPEGTGQSIIRKLVTFTNSGSRFRTGDDVDTDIDLEGNAVINDLEIWEPDYEKTKRKPPAKHHRKHRKLA